MSTFNKKWSELTKQEKQAAKTQYGNNAKQQWQDAKAKSQGFKDEQDRRGNSGERHKANNPPAQTTTAPVTDTANANANAAATTTTATPASASTAASNQTAASTAPSNTQENQATNDLHMRLGLNTDSNASYEDTRSKYQNLYRNARAHGVATTDLYAKAGLRDPEEYKKEWQQDPNAFRSKYGVENFGEVMKATGHVELENLKGSWRKADTVDKATINLDPEAYGELGQQVNDKSYQQNFDFTTPAPIQVNALGGQAYYREKDKLEQQYGKSLNTMNKEINPNDKTNYNFSPSQRQGTMDYFVDTVANKYNQSWAHKRNEQRGSDYKYGKGFYDLIYKQGTPGGGQPLQDSGKKMLGMNYKFDPNKFNQGQ